MSHTSIDTATGKQAPAQLSSERVKDIFSHIAQRYERFNAISSFGQYRIWLNKMVQAAPVDASSLVLDVAGGTGDVTFALARAKHPQRILCTDLVPEMLDVAREHYAKGKGDGVNISFETADAQNLPYADASFDVLTVAYGLRNMPERERALAEMKRVLKPGGTLVCLEFSTPSNPLWKGLYHFYLAYMIPFWGSVICKRKEDFVYLSQSIKAFPNQEGLAAMMKDAGFAEVNWQNCLGGIAAVHVATKQ